MRKTLLPKMLLLLCALMAGSVSVWAAEKTITLTQSSFGLTTSYSEKTATVDGYGFTVNQGYKGGSASAYTIQMNSTKGNGVLYNTTAITGLKSVTVNVSSMGSGGSYAVKTGTSQNPTTNSSTGNTTTKTFTAESGDTYFELKVTKVCYFTSIVITYEPVETYELTLSDAVGGTYTVTNGETAVKSGDKFSAGTSLTLTATPGTGYSFSTWTASAGTIGTATDNPTTFAMPSSTATIGATFTPNSYTFTALTDNDGKLSVKVGDAAAEELSDGDTKDIPYNSTVTVTPVPATDYAFDEWVTTDIDGINTKANPLVFTMPANAVELMAGFISANIEYDIDIEQETGGTISADKMSAKAGETVTLSYVLTDGYAFGEWVVLDGSGNDVVVTGNQFTMPTSKVTVGASYKKIYEVLYSVQGVETTVSRVEGEALNLPTPSAVAGMPFAGWVASDDVTATPTFVANTTAVTDDMILYAFFTIKEGEYAYKLVEENQTDWRGDYLIAYSNTIFANGKTCGNDGIGKQNSEVSPASNLSGNTVTTTWGDQYYVTLEAIDDDDLTQGYLLKTQDGYYNYQTSDDNGVKGTSNNKSTAAKYPITVSFVSSDEINLTLSTKPVFRYNNTGGYFRFYKSASYSSMGKIYLYKKVKGNATYTLGAKSVKITSAEYATYYADENLDFSGTGITVYTATDNETSVSLNEVTSGKVPAGTAVVLYKEGADGTPVNVPVATSAAAVEGTNDLHVVGEGGLTGEDNIYVLAKKNDKVGFYLWDKTATLNEGKIYLQGKATYGAREFLGFDDNGTTSINEELGMKNDEFANAPVFNLNGQRVSQPTKGLYIVDGRKVVIR